MKSFCSQFLGGVIMVIVRCHHDKRVHRRSDHQLAGTVDSANSFCAGDGANRDKFTFFL